MTIPDHQLVAHHLDKAKVELMKAAGLVEPCSRIDSFIGAALLGVNAAKKELPDGA